MTRELKNGSEHSAALHALIAEYLAAADAGAAPDRASLLLRHPDLAGDLQAFFVDHDRLKQLAHLPAAAGTLDVLARMASPPGRGDRLLDDYELLEEVGRGGMGVVYKARQISLNRTVAVKMILAGRLADTEDVRRFRAEAEAAANLRHPNIIAIHDVGAWQGQPFFSMDYIDGKSLAEMVRASPLPAKRAARYAQAIASAVHYAHERGTLHRDLKPSNILIDQTDQPHIADFGLAKQVAADARLTGSGQVLGTPSYMPPEQAASGRGPVGPASDVYALGAVLYELLTGRPPFRAETPVDTLLQVLEAEPAAPRLLNPTVPRDLETVCLKCLRKEPAERYGSARDLALDLDRFLADEPVRARPVGLAERVWRWARRNRLAAGLVVAALAGVLVLGSLWTVRAAARARIETAAREFVALIALEQFDQAAERLDDAIKADTPAILKTWRTVWRQTLRQNGAFRSQGKTMLQKRLHDDLVFILLVFEKSELVVEVVLSPARRVTGFWIVGQGPVEVAPRSVATAARFVERLTARRFDEAASDLDANVGPLLTPAALQSMWGQLTDLLGALRRQAVAGTRRLEGYDVVYVTLSFEKGTVHFEIALDEDQKVAGLHQVAAEMLPDGPAPAPARRP